MQKILLCKIILVFFNIKTTRQNIKLSSHPAFPKFLQFQTEYQKKYFDLNEIEFRFFNFLKNSELIAKENRNYKQKGWDLRLKINHFGDLSLSEIRNQLFLNSKINSFKNLSENKNKKSKKIEKPNSLFQNFQINQSYPKNLFKKPSKKTLQRINQKFLESIKIKTVNWSVQTGHLAIRDQKTCGSCYAMASADAIETNYYINNQKKIECSVEKILEDSEKYGNAKCEGGFPHLVFEYMKKEGVPLVEKNPWWKFEHRDNSKIGNFFIFYENITFFAVE